jgi:hypothetical protein
VVVASVVHLLPPVVLIHCNPGPQRIFALLSHDSPQDFSLGVGVGVDAGGGVGVTVGVADGGGVLVGGGFTFIVTSPAFVTPTGPLPNDPFGPVHDHEYDLHVQSILVVVQLLCPAAIVQLPPDCAPSQAFPLGHPQFPVDVTVQVIF